MKNFQGLAKHGGREDSIFPKPTGNPSQINEQGQNFLESILNHPEKVINYDSTPRLGKFFDIQVPGVGGARYNLEGDFIGFLEPPR